MCQYERQPWHYTGLFSSYLEMGPTMAEDYRGHAMFAHGVLAISGPAPAHRAPLTFLL